MMDSLAVVRRIFSMASCSFWRMNSSDPMGLPRTVMPGSSTLLVLQSRGSGPASSMNRGCGDQTTVFSVDRSSPRSGPHLVMICITCWS